MPMDWAVKMRDIFRQETKYMREEIFEFKNVFKKILRSLDPMM